MSVIIVIYHYNFFLLGWNSNILFRGGYICVDAFFVISGFMCAKVLLSLSRETSFFSWLKRRLMTLYPYYIAALIPAVCTGVYLNGFHGMRRVIAILEELVMIQEWGIINCFPYYNGATWYISAMMFVSCVYFFLSKKFTPKIQAYIIAALSALCFSVIVIKYGHIHVHGVIRRVVSLGIMRGFAGMGVGWLVFTFRDNIRLKYPGAIFALSVIMLVSVCLYTKNTYADILIYPAAAAVIISSRGIDVKPVMLQRMMIFSGKMSYALYLCHGFVQGIMLHFLHDYTLSAFMAVSLAVSFSMMVIVGKIQRHVTPQ